MRQIARTDDNQAEIVQALRQVGASVILTHQLGAGVPDIAVGFRGINYWFEIKDGGKPPSRRMLTSDEETWHSTWRGHVAVVESVEEALMKIGATK